MAKTATYSLIQSQTLGSATASVTFSSIPQGYTDLILVISGRVSSTTGNNNSGLRFNGDSGTNYSMTRIAGDGTSATSDRVANTSYAGWALVANSSVSEFTPVIYNIQDYSNSTTYKTIMGRGNWASLIVTAVTSLWRSTSAITSIEVIQTGTNWVTGSNFKLYGIEAYK